MQPPSKPAAPDALHELAALVQLAHGAASRAQSELRGEAGALASRVAQHLRYLRGVSELLMHEATREPGASSAGATATLEHDRTRLP